MATIIVRQLGPNSEPFYGQGLQNYLTDQAAVLQIIQTKLLLLQGEWWENLADGTPLFQQILGPGNNTSKLQLISNILQQRILSVPYVTGISNAGIILNSTTRQATFGCNVLTQFGTSALTLPLPGSNLSLS